MKRINVLELAFPNAKFFFTLADPFIFICVCQSVVLFTAAWVMTHSLQGGSGRVGVSGERKGGGGIGR